MVVRFKKKRRRGERTYHGRHGYPRGAGSRGGRGNAGLHKHKWLYTLKYARDHFGKEGFRYPLRKEKKIINLIDINEKIEEFLNLQIAKKENGKIVIDLTKAGYDKLLAKGNLNFQAEIIVKEASKKAIEKVEKLGGKVILK